MTETAVRPTFAAMRRMLTMAATTLAGLTGGCVNVAAPDKPIEINLNIRVTQEVIYRLETSTKQLIQQNPDIF